MTEDEDGPRSSLIVVGVATDEDWGHAYVSECVGDTEGVEVLRAPPDDIDSWSGFSIIVYDEHQVGGDTVPTLEDVPSVFVASVEGWSAEAGRRVQRAIRDVMSRGSGGPRPML